MGCWTTPHSLATDGRADGVNRGIYSQLACIVNYGTKEDRAAHCSLCVQLSVLAVMCFLGGSSGVCCLLSPALLIYQFRKQIMLWMLESTRNVVEGTRGPFYTIGRLSLPAADTLRRKQTKTKRES